MGNSQSKLIQGFDADEYRKCLQITAQQTDTNYAEIPTSPPGDCTLLYHSEDMGLDNQWNLWTDEDSVLYVSIRGSVGRAGSWMQNFYSAMVAAEGEMKLPNDQVFKYVLAKNPQATVHVGWTLGLAYLAPDILSQLQEYHQKGYQDLIITGHSQGGVLSMLFSSYFHYNSDLAQKYQWKTYASAPPKPGNQAFAYDFDFIHKDRVFRVVNSSDWVPESPISVQTLEDMNETSPFRNADELFGQMGFLQRVVVRRVYKAMSSELEEARDQIHKNVGKRTYKYVDEELGGFEQPEVVPSEFFVTCGIPIVLPPVDGYEDYVDSLNKDSAFRHHLYYPYWFLINAHYPIEEVETSSTQAP